MIIGSNGGFIKSSNGGISVSSSNIYISINDVSVDEGSDAIFTVTLSKPAPTGGVSVIYNTQNISAIAGTDYTAVVDGILTIPQGGTSGTITISTINRLGTEGQRTFQVVLSSPVNGFIIDNIGVATINDIAQGNITQWWTTEPYNDYEIILEWVTPDGLSPGPTGGGYVGTTSPTNGTNPNPPIGLFKISAINYPNSGPSFNAANVAIGDLVDTPKSIYDKIALDSTYGDGTGKMGKVIYPVGEFEFPYYGSLNKNINIMFKGTLSGISHPWLPTATNTNSTRIYQLNSGRTKLATMFNLNFVGQNDRIRFDDIIIGKYNPYASINKGIIIAGGKGRLYMHNSCIEGWDDNIEAPVSETFSGNSYVQVRCKSSVNRLGGGGSSGGTRHLIYTHSTNLLELTDCLLYDPSSNSHAVKFYGEFMYIDGSMIVNHLSSADYSTSPAVNWGSTIIDIAGCSEGVIKNSVLVMKDNVDVNGNTISPDTTNIIYKSRRNTYFGGRGLKRPDYFVYDPVLFPSKNLTVIKWYNPATGQFEGPSATLGDYRGKLNNTQPAGTNIVYFDAVRQPHEHLNSTEINTGSPFNDVNYWNMHFTLDDGAGNYSVHTTTGTLYNYEATATATITNGSISSITVTNGSGAYKTPPAVTITGDGTGASATATIDSSGTVTGITVTNGGSGYTTATVSMTRPHKYAFLLTTPVPTGFSILANSFCTFYDSVNGPFLPELNKPLHDPADPNYIWSGLLSASYTDNNRYYNLYIYNNEFKLFGPRTNRKMIQNRGSWPFDGIAGSTNGGDLALPPQWHQYCSWAKPTGAGTFDANYAILAGRNNWLGGSPATGLGGAEGSAYVEQSNVMIRNNTSVFEAMPVGNSGSWDVLSGKYKEDNPGENPLKRTITSPIYIVDNTGTEVRSNTNPTEPTTIQTTLSVAANVNDSNITVTSSAGMAIGDRITITVDDDPWAMQTGLWSHKAKIINISGNTITLDSAMTFAASAGNSVSVIPYFSVPAYYYTDYTQEPNIAPNS